MNIYDATSRFPGTCLGANLQGLAIDSQRPRDSPSPKGCEGVAGQADLPDLIFDTDSCPTPPLHSPGLDSNAKALPSLLLSDWSLARFVLL